MTPTTLPDLESHSGAEAMPVDASKECVLGGEY